MIALAIAFGMVMGVLGSREWRRWRDRSDAAYMARPVMPDSMVDYFATVAANKNIDYTMYVLRSSPLRRHMRLTHDQMTRIARRMGNLGACMVLRDFVRHDLLMLEHAQKAQEAIEAEETRALLGEPRLKAVNE